jgi:HK97 family phage major capsid protein
MLKELEQFKSELAEDIKGHLDTALQEKVKTLIGDERAGIVREAVEQLRVEKLMLGHDKTGLSDAQKSEFAKFVKSIAIPSAVKANETIIGEQDSRGGYLVPTEVANAILRVAATVGVAMSQCARWDMKTDELDIPSYAGSFLEGEYLGVDAAGNVTGITFKMARLLAKPWQLAFVVGKDLLADATPAVGEWLIALAAEALANMVDKQVFIGTGNPFVGIMSSADVAAYSLASGATGFGNYKVVDDSSDVIANVEESVLDSAAFYFSRTNWAKFRAQKDTAGNYLLPQAGSLLSANPRNGGPKPAGEILGFPVYTVRHLPAYSASAAGTKFGVFGNLKAVALGMKGEMEMERYNSGTFGGKEIALARQVGMVMGNRHAAVIALAAALTTIKTAAT